MQKNIKEPKSKKLNQQNKLKKALYPKNTKPIEFETYIGIANLKAKKKKNTKPKNKAKNDTISLNPSRKTKNRNISQNYQTNKSQNKSNILELDYLNFSRIDLGLRKLNSSFEEDMFNSKIFIKEKKELVSYRYNGVESSFDNSKTESNSNLNNNNINYIRESKEKLLKTPSTLCNYYDKSEATTSQKKNNINNNFNNINNKNIEIKNELRKNLDKLYEETKNDGIEYINVNKKNNSQNQNQNVINWKLKDSIKIKKEKEKEKKEEDYSKTLNENKKELNKLIFDIKRDFAKNQSQKKYSNNLMENYLNSKIVKPKKSFNTSSSKKNYVSNKLGVIPKEISKTLKYTNDNININYNTNNNTQDINSLINVNFNSTTNNNNNNNNKNIIINKKANNTTNGVYYLNINKNAKNYKHSSHSGQKPIILCYDQIKYDSYFVTPKNAKKIKKGKKVQTSTKSTKFDSNSRGVGNNTNNNKDINSKNQSNKSNKNSDFNIIVNNLIKTKNKSFNKNLNNNFNNNFYNKNKNNKNNNNNRIIYINNNLKNHKSSSLLIRQPGALSSTKGGTSQKSNSNINTILQLLNSGVKKNSDLLQDLLSKINYSNAKSPLKKYKSSNALKISKTLTENNILNRMQVTPKYNKIPKGSNALTTTLVKRNIYIGSNGKNNNKGIKYHNSTVKKNNKQFFGSSNNYKDIFTNLFNHKTQSDFKTNKYFVLNNSNINSNNTNKYNNNNEYGNDKHIKQKLLDRMNNATNNGWHYVFRGNKNSNNNNKNNGNKKVLMENLSEIMKSPDKKDFINNDTIISNESDDDKEKK